MFDTISDYCPGFLPVTEGCEEVPYYVQFRQPPAPCRPRLGATAEAFSIAHRPPHVSRSCVHNALNGVLRRCVVRQPLPLEVLEARLQADLDLLDEMYGIGLLTPQYVPPTNRDFWYSRFPPTRRAALIRALELTGGQSRGMKSNSFNKRELINKFFYFTPSVDARSIQNPHPATTAAFGPRYHALSKALARDWHSDAQLFFTCGATPEKLGRMFEDFFEFAGPRGVILCIDGNRFDGHESLESMGLEAAHDAYYGAPYHVQRVLYPCELEIDWRRTMRARIPMIRPSGIVNTTSGNSKTSGYACLKGASNLGESRNQTWRAAVIGDDNLVAVKPIASRSKIIEAFKSGFEHFGHDVKLTATTTDQFLAADYNSGFPFLTSLGSRVWAPKPGRAILKMGWRFNNGRKDPNWLASSSASWLHDCGHVPVIRALAQRMADIARALDQHPEALRDDDRRRPHTETRYSCDLNGLIEFCARYDLMPEDVMLCENRIAAMSRGQRLDDWVINRITQVDVPLNPEHHLAHVECSIPGALHDPPAEPVSTQLPGEDYLHTRAGCKDWRKELPFRKMVFQRHLRTLRRTPAPLSILSALYVLCLALCGCAPLHDAVPRRKSRARLSRFNCSSYMSDAKPAAKPAAAPRSSKPARGPPDIRAMVNRITSDLGRLQGSIARAEGPRNNQGGGRMVRQPRSKPPAMPARNKNTGGQVLQRSQGGRGRSGAPSAIPKSLSSKVGATDALRLLHDTLLSVPPRYRYVVASIALPFIFGTVRANGGACKETAVCTPYTVTPVEFGLRSAVYGGEQLGIGDAMSLIFRDATNFSVTYHGNPNKSQWAMNCVFGESPIDVGDWVQFYGWVSAGSYTPYGSGYAKLNSLGNPCMWVDRPPTNASGSTATLLNLADAGVSVDYVWKVQSECGGVIKEELLLATSSAGGDLVVTLPFGSVTGSSYVAMQLVSLSSGTQSNPSLFQFTGNSTTFAHQPLPSFSKMATAVENISVNVASNMFSNTSSNLNKQGKLVQLQAPAGVEWPTLVGLSITGNSPGGNATNWQTISQYPGAVPRPAEKGGYSFLKPEGMQVFQRKTVQTQVASGIQDGATSRTLPQNDYLFMYMTASVNTGEDAYWTQVGGAEFETDDLTRERKAPTTPALDFIASQDQVTPMTQHHENSSHIGNILGMGLGAIANPAGFIEKGVTGIINSLFS